jgi:hypothetical protein
MTTLNRFPLLALWAREAAHRLGYNDADAGTLGHAYAVLYAIRANSTVRPVTYRDQAAAESARTANELAAPHELLSFGGDQLQVQRRPDGRLVGRVGEQMPQTAESYRYKVVAKYPAGWHDRLQGAFRAFLAGYDPQRLDSRLIYSLYDQWKRACAAGSLVDLGRVIDWCEQRRPAAASSAPGSAPPAAAGGAG